MATIVNTPPSNQESQSSSGGMFLIGAIILLVTVFLFIYYGVPAIQNTAQSVPTQPTQQGTTVEVPDEIDVNVSGSTEGGQ